MTDILGALTNFANTKIWESDNDNAAPRHDTPGASAPTPEKLPDQTVSDAYAQVLLSELQLQDELAAFLAQLANLQPIITGDVKVLYLASLRASGLANPTVLLSCFQARERLLAEKAERFKVSLTDKKAITASKDAKIVDCQKQITDLNARIAELTSQRNAIQAAITKAESRFSEGVAAVGRYMDVVRSNINTYLLSGGQK